MRRISTLAAGVACVLGTGLGSAPAHALEVVPYTTTSLTAADPVQRGRLTRARPPSDWATAPTPFPGFINTTTDYSYRAIDATLAANALQDIYYEITVDDEDAIVFASAYDGAYDPSAPATRYLGDEGSSGNYFPGDPSFFDIVVTKGGTLSLVFNSVGAGFGPFAYQVSAFSDTQYDEDFLTPAVPEPATWAMLLLGMGAIGMGLRAHRPTVTVRYA